MGKLIDITSRLKSVPDEPRQNEPLFGPPAPAENAAGHEVLERKLGERPDGTIDLASWRARWRSVFKKEFVLDLGKGRTAPEGSLHFFHDPKSNSLEFLAMPHEGSGVRHVLKPTEAMELILALNSAYGFDPQGPDGRKMSEWETGDDGPTVA